MSCNNRYVPRRRRAQRGAALLEFLICTVLVWMPLMLGAGQYGFSLIRAILVSEACRDFGRMFAYGIDFSQKSNQYLLASTAPTLGVDPAGAGGSGVVIFSMVQYLTDADCQAGGYATTCPNSGELVFITRVVVGNPQIRGSAFGTPANTTSGGGVLPGSPNTSGYLNDASDLVRNFPNISLNAATSGQKYGYICEVYAKSLGINWFAPSSSSWISEYSFF